MTLTQSPGRIQKMDPPYGSTIYTIGVLESRIRGSVFWILPGLCDGLRMARLQDVGLNGLVLGIMVLHCEVEGQEVLPAKDASSWSKSCQLIQMPEIGFNK